MSKTTQSDRLKGRGLRLGGFGILFVGIVVSMQNCSNVNLARLPGEIKIASVAPEVLPRLEPVLAVRNTACIMCHAQINGDLVTDLGVGSPFVMGTDAIANHPSQSYYSPFASKHFIWSGGTWSGSSVMGNIYVPDAEIRDARLISAYANPKTGNPTLTKALTILDFLRGKHFNPTIEGGKVVEVIPTTTSKDQNVPGLRGKFYAKKSIWIDAPQADEIRSLMRGPTVQTVSTALGAILAKNKEADVIKGLATVKSMRTSKNFFQNQTVMTCKGDILIDGVLFLNNLILNTDNAGCRLYVTGSVFIQGAIIYSNGDESNLQISSASAIIMGIKTLSPRLTQLYTSATVSGVRLGPNDPSELALNAKIIDDSVSVDGLRDDAGPLELMLNRSGKVIAGMDSFDDKIYTPLGGGSASAIPAASTCTSIGVEADAAKYDCSIIHTGSIADAKLYRKEINYEHLLLNAPKIHSRYYGIFKGVIIGEDVLFAVNHFMFDKDPVMINIDLLPLLRDRVFKMEDLDPGK